MMARVHAGIAQAGGWLPFDRYMSLVLYAPGLGYYARDSRQFGRMPASGSDFVTAPELSPLFAQALAAQLAQALAPRLRVCGVAPGITLHSGDMDDDEFERAHRMTPLQRSSTPDDVAQAVRYLLSATAVTGTTLLVDGGQHLQAQPRDVMFMARESKSS